MCPGGRGGFGYINGCKINNKGGLRGVAANPTVQTGYKLVLQKRQNNVEYNRRIIEKQVQSLRKHFQLHGSHWKGRKHSDSTKEKIGKANSHHQCGKKNSNFGNMWIHNPTTKISKLIKKDDIIPLGWVRGRKINFID